MSSIPQNPDEDQIIQQLSSAEQIMISNPEFFDQLLDQTISICLNQDYSNKIIIKCLTIYNNLYYFKKIKINLRIKSCFKLLPILKINLLNSKNYIIVIKCVEIFNSIYDLLILNLIKPSILLNINNSINLIEINNDLEILREFIIDNWPSSFPLLELNTETDNYRSIGCKIATVKLFGKIIRTHLPKLKDASNNNNGNGSNSSSSSSSSRETTPDSDLINIDKFDENEDISIAMLNSSTQNSVIKNKRDFEIKGRVVLDLLMSYLSGVVLLPTQVFSTVMITLMSLFKLRSNYFSTKYINFILGYESQLKRSPKFDNTDKLKLRLIRRFNDRIDKILISFLINKGFIKDSNLRARFDKKFRYLDSRFQRQKSKGILNSDDDEGDEEIKEFKKKKLSSTNPNDISVILSPSPTPSSLTTSSSKKDNEIDNSAQFNGKKNEIEFYNNSKIPRGNDYKDIYSLINPKNEIINNFDISKIDNFALTNLIINALSNTDVSRLVTGLDIVSKRYQYLVPSDANNVSPTPQNYFYPQLQQQQQQQLQQQPQQQPQQQQSPPPPQQLPKQETTRDSQRRSKKRKYNNDEDDEEDEDYSFKPQYAPNPNPDLSKLTSNLVTSDSKKQKLKKTVTFQDKVKTYAIKSEYSYHRRKRRGRASEDDDVDDNNEDNDEDDEEVTLNDAIKNKSGNTDTDKMDEDEDDDDSYELPQYNSDDETTSDSTKASIKSDVDDDDDDDDSYDIDSTVKYEPEEAHQVKAESYGVLPPPPPPPPPPANNNPNQYNNQQNQNGDNREEEEDEDDDDANYLPDIEDFDIQPYKTPVSKQLTIDQKKNQIRVIIEQFVKSGIKSSVMKFEEQQQQQQQQQQQDQDGEAATSDLDKVAIPNWNKSSWLVLLTRLATRGLNNRESESSESAESAESTESEELVNNKEYSKIIKTALFDYFKEDIKVRIEGVIEWLNEEWYDCDVRNETELKKKSNDNTSEVETDKNISDEENEKIYAEYLKWCSKILDNLVPFLEPTDRKIFIKLLSDLPYLNKDLIFKLRSLCQDPVRSKLGFQSILYLIMFRPPVVGYCIQLLKDMYFNSGNNDSLKAESLNYLKKYASPEDIAELENSNEGEEILVAKATTTTTA